MRFLTRLYVVVLMGTLTAGPLTAASVSLPDRPTVSRATFAPGFAGTAVAVLTGLSLAVFGAIKVKDTATIAQKFVTRAQGAQKDYSDGVAGAGNDWMTNSKNAGPAWAQGTQDAITDGRYVKGIDGKGGKFVANATKLGAQRYGPGVANAVDAFTRGVQPYLDKIKSLTLPPRGPRRSPQNQQRASMVATELGKLKVGH